VSTSSDLRNINITVLLNRFKYQIIVTGTYEAPSDAPGRASARRMRHSVRQIKHASGLESRCKPGPYFDVAVLGRLFFNYPSRPEACGPKGPEPALGFSEKKTGLSHFGRDSERAKQAKQQKFCPHEPGGRANVFSFYVIIITLTFKNVTFSFTLLRYVTVAGANLKRSSRLRTLRLAVTSQCRIPISVSPF
jgi:hypothetical protein